ncbi:MAG: hypothetical protein NE328_13765 [Lentisphaeraceae bacterium]|nr:hypothetical protein [Lentisphaeraceae bacterium]
MSRVVAISEYAHELLKQIVKKRKSDGKRSKQGEVVDNLILEKAKEENILN